MKQETTTEDGNNQPRRNPALLVIAYLCHLVVPALFLVDVVAGWLRGQIALEPWGADVVVGGSSAVWLAAGLGALIFSRDRAGFVWRIHQPLVAIYATYVMLILVEGFAHLLIPVPPIPYLNPPGTKRVFTVDPNLDPGVRGTKTFTVNELGLRGPMPPKRGSAYRILAVGASTTICSNLDDSEEWPHALMEELNANPRSSPVWVGNAGVSGMTTVHHLVLLQWLPGVLRVDMVIFLVGINDLTASLSFEGAPTQAFLEKEAGFRGDLPAGTRWRSQYPLYRRLRLFLLVRGAAGNLGLRFGGSGSERPFNLVSFRQRRAASPTVPLPDLHTGLQEYSRRLLLLASRCRALDLRCLFLTQPSMWRSDLSPAEQRLLWFGYVGHWENPKGYASAADLARAMDAYNHALLDVCQQNGLECYDLASQIPKDTSALSDDVHFNEAGARLVAQSVKQYLLSKPPMAWRDPGSVPDHKTRKRRYG